MESVTLVREPERVTVHILIEDDEEPLGVAQCGQAATIWRVVIGEWAVAADVFCADCFEGAGRYLKRRGRPGG